MDKNQVNTSTSGKTSLDDMSKEELVIKCKGLLNLAKKAKTAKDEHAEENRKLKEALAESQSNHAKDKNMIVTLNEMVEEFTNNKLAMTTELSEIKKNYKKDNESLIQLRIENESLNRQITRLTDDNESLLKNINDMEEQLQQVNLLGKEQQKHLNLLELEVNKLKDAETSCKAMQTEIAELKDENKTLKEKCSKNVNELAQLSSKYQSVKEINSEQRQKFNSLKERFVEIYRKLNKIKESRRILLETQNEYAEAISNWQKEIINASQQLCAHITALKRENYTLKNNLEAKSNVGDRVNYTITEFSVQTLLDKLSTMQDYCLKACQEREGDRDLLQTLQDENDKLRRELEIADLGKNLNSSNTKDETTKQKNTPNSDSTNTENITEKLNLSSQDVEQLYEELASYKKENAVLLSTLEDKNSEIVTIMEKLKDMETSHVENGQNSVEKCPEKMNGNASELELLQKALQKKDLEVEELNRIIDHLEKVVNTGPTPIPVSEAAATEIFKLRDELQVTSQKFEDTQSALQKKERENSDLLIEMKELNEALKARGDVISRQEEKQQELVTEMQQTTLSLSRIEKELNTKDALIQDKEIQISTLGKQINSVRDEITRLQLACQENEQQIASLPLTENKTLNVDQQNEEENEKDEDLEDKCNKLRIYAAKSKHKIQEQKQLITELEERIHDVQSELNKSESDRKTIQSEHEQCTKLIDSLKTEISKLKSSRKHNSVLNLEIEAFEKSLNETTAKLTAKTTEFETFRETLHSRDNTIDQLRKEITILELSKEAECTHSIELKDQIDHLQQQIKDLVHSKHELSTKIKDLEQVKENLQNDLEDLRLQLANNVSARNSEKLVMQSDKEALLRKVAELEEQNATKQTNLKVIENCLENLRIEYLDYKIKAQAVLRKNQSNESFKERELEEELVTMRVEQQQAAEKLASYLEKINITEKAINNLREDNENLQRRNKELMDLITELRQQNEVLSQENHHQIQQYQDSLKTHRLQIDNLDACHKQQIKTLEEQHLREIEKVKNFNLKAIEGIRQAPSIGGPKTVAAHPDQNKIDIILMEREAAEGSEEADLLAAASRRKTSSSISRSNHGFMPLDELLSSPMNFTNDTVFINSDFDAVNDVEHVSPQIALQTTKERLQIQESRVRHLTALLAENEQDLAKLTQLNDMLKEEVRRYERTVEREQHMQNSEYVKNVILKFLTLNNVDERTRLIPVLNTILKLNRSETEMLNAVAKGQKVAAPDSSRNWSNFLTTW